MSKPLADSYGGVVVRPTEVTFACDSNGCLAPVEFVVLNKSQQTLRFKVLSTARSSYRLSKCRGVLKPEELIKISVEFVSCLPENNRRDHFKIQFFDCRDNLLQGERLISSSVWSTEAACTPFQTLDSDSCTSFTGLSTDTSSAIVSARAALATRPIRSSCGTVEKSSLVRTSECDSSLHTPLVDSKAMAKQSGKLRSSTVSKKQTLGALPAPLSRADSISFPHCDLLNHLRCTLCITATLLCFVGICLPFIVNDITGVLQWIYPGCNGFSHSSYFAIVRRPTCSRFAPPDIAFSSSPSSFCQTNQPYNKLPKPDSFSYHCKLAYQYLRAAIQNSLEAILVVNPVNVIASLSWFFLGMLLMYLMLRR